MNKSLFLVHSHPLTLLTLLFYPIARNKKAILGELGVKSRVRWVSAFFCAFGLSACFGRRAAR